MSEHKRLRHFVACVARTFHLWPFIARSGMYTRARRRKYPDTLVYLDVVITECCTLKCRNCSNLMQYYHKPENLSPDEVIYGLKRLLTAFKVNRLNILGGEPFVCQKNLMRLLEFLRNEAKDRVNEIVIITNGTVIPSDECLRVIKDTPDLRILFSNYGSLSSKLEEFSAVCRREGIKCDVVEDEFWWDFGDLKRRDEKDRKTQHRYDACYSRKHCTTLFRGKLYECPRQAHAVRLGIIPEDPSENVDLLRPEFEDAGLLHDEIYRLIDRKEYISVCKHCGCDSEIKIPRAVQTEKPVDVI